MCSQSRYLVSCLESGSQAFFFLVGNNEKDVPDVR